MYTSTVFTGQVRDAPARYGGGWLEREEFPAEGVLRDLRSCGSGRDALRIVARYCAIRLVLLREAGAEAGLVEHARDAAVGHLDGVDARWPEAAGLRRLVERREPVEVVTALLAEAAASAEAEGHRHGAYAARRTAYVLARRRLPAWQAARLARGVAAFLRRSGEPGRARSWERRADRLAGRDGGAGPPAAG